MSGWFSDALTKIGNSQYIVSSETVEQDDHPYVTINLIEPDYLSPSE